MPTRAAGAWRPAVRTSVAVPSVRRAQAASSCGKSVRKWAPRLSRRARAAAVTSSADGDRIAQLSCRRFRARHRRPSSTQRPRQAHLVAHQPGVAPEAARAAPCGSGGPCARGRSRPDRRSSHADALAPGARRAGTAASQSPRAAMSSPTRAPKTSASSSELLASRLAPCIPVEATSPQAQRPGSEVRPARSVATPPMW